ncbi:MAG: ankyrin repeat domain-containing protein [Fimbriimonadaceae bacterium]
MSLPPKPSLEHLKKQAKELHAAYGRNEADALKTVAPYFQPGSALSLTQAQLVLAREYGFASWEELTRHVESAGEALAEFVEAAIGGQTERAKELWHTRREHLRAHPAAAALSGDIEMFRDFFLSRKPELVTQPLPPKEWPALCYVAFSRLIAEPEFEQPILETAKFLLEAGADPNSYYMAQWAGEDFKATAIYGAAGVTNHAGLTKLLLDAGADPNEGQKDAPRYSGEALYHACDHPGHNECLRLLLEAGMSQPARDWCICRKLDFEDIEGVKLFLDHGANPDKAALRHALLRNRSVEMIKLLLDYGANPNAPDPDGTTPYVLARRYGLKAQAALLVERGATTELEPYDALLVAAADGDVGLVQALAAAHPEILDRATNYGRQPNDGQPLGSGGSILHDLARAGQAAGLAALIDLGMNAGTTNNYNETPLHWACVAGRVDAAKALVERGAPLDVREKNHQADPIGWAYWGSEYWHEPHGDYVATIEYLLSKGGRLADHIQGSPEVRELLMAKGVK